eukprot:scaffold100565_cov23-Cyclotella_meneghiniana.AAC.1
MNLCCPSSAPSADFCWSSTLVVNSTSARPPSSTTLNRLTIKGEFVLLVLRVYRGGLFRRFE